MPTTTQSQSTKAPPPASAASSQSCQRAIQRIVVALVHPSNYDHQYHVGGIGSFVQTYRYGVIPSNTLRLIQSLTSEALGQPFFKGIKTEVHSYEDGIRKHQRAYQSLLNRFPERGTLLVVGLVAVQSNQFPRACDLIEQARETSAHVVIGGPHITAAINTSFYGISAIDPMRPNVVCPRKMPPEIQRLIDDPQVVVFHGDADARQPDKGSTAWHDVLADIATGNEKPYYEAGMAASIGNPGIVYDHDQLEAYASPVAAIDTERGCPFKCKFCAAVQAHGRSVRSRQPEQVVDWIRRQCESFMKPITVLFASDNIARNPHWRELFKGLYQLKREGHQFSIWAEADVRCNSGPNAGFLDEYVKAGGEGLFLGIESMNPENLEDAGKRQNAVEQLPHFFEECRKRGIAPEGGYIIGFDHDSPESIAADVHHLMEAGLARAWFFIKTLLPGSQDYVEAEAAGTTISADLNEYDSTIVTYEHPRMTSAEWKQAYHAAIRSFYSMRSMISILSRYEDARQRWRLIKGFLWCRWAYLTERSHPMIAGFYRYRPFSGRRPGQPALSRLRYLAAEAWRHMRYVGHFFREFYMFQYVILETELRLRYDERRHGLESELRNCHDWFQRTFSAPMCRGWLNGFWKKYGAQKWRLLNPFAGLRWHLKMLPYAATEVIYTMRFTRLFIRGLTI
jgi:radical SAM superfamily enzyme YgiQ (UPF0313 family)